MFYKGKVAIGQTASFQGRYDRHRSAVIDVGRACCPEVTERLELCGRVQPSTQDAH